MKKLPTLLIALAGFSTAGTFAQTHMNHEHHDMKNHDMKPVKDTRIAVKFPAAARATTLAQMRNHLEAISEIHELLGKNDLEGAGKLAAKRLSMDAMHEHGAHESASYMPSEMQALGASMHRAAGRFATISQDAAVNGKPETAWAALSEVTKACVACHATYKVQ